MSQNPGPASQALPTGAPRQRPLFWPIVVCCIAAAGVVAGLLLPGGGPSSTDGGTAAVEDTVPSVADSTAPSPETFTHAADTERRLSGDDQRIVREFPLSAADLRDTQEAPALAIDRQGHVHFAWASKTRDASRTLFFTTASNRQLDFDEPRAIATSGIFKSGGGTAAKGGGHERRMLPRLAVGADTLLLAWCDAPMDGSSIRMLLAESGDAGRTFGPPTPLHATDSARPTFTSLATNGAGQVAAAWLDCRQGPQQVYAAVREAGSPEFLPDSLVFAGQDDLGVCPCCPTESRVLEDGTVLVAYRGQVDGFRDIWICRRSPGPQGRFSEPLPVVKPTWTFDGCPHDGPSLAVVGDWVHVAWMDARTGRQRVYYGRARLADMKFAVRELHAAGPGTQGNPKLIRDDLGRLHAVWEESLDTETFASVQPAAASQPTSGKARAKAAHDPLADGAGRAVMYASSPEANGEFQPARSVMVRPGRFQIRPALACGADGVLVAAWMELDESGKRVVVTSWDEPVHRLPQTAQLSGGGP